MTRDELEQTEWAKAFKADAPVSYERALQLAENPYLRVEIYRNDEAGVWQWAISAVVRGEYTGFWMDAKPTKKEALELCRRMGWKIAR